MVKQCAGCENRTDNHHDFCPDCGGEFEDEEYNIEFPVTTKATYESYNEYVDFGYALPDDVRRYLHEETNNDRATAKYAVFNLHVELTVHEDGRVDVQQVSD